MFVNTLTADDKYSLLNRDNLRQPILRREYLSSAVNVLTNTYKALHLTKTDFFRLNYLENDHQIW